MILVIILTVVAIIPRVPPNLNSKAPNPPKSQRSSGASSGASPARFSWVARTGEQLVEGLGFRFLLQKQMPPRVAVQWAPRACSNYSCPCSTGFLGTLQEMQNEKVLFCSCCYLYDVIEVVKLLRS